MATIYTHKRFNNPETERVNLSAAVTGGKGATGNTDFNDIVDLGRGDVGAIIKVNTTNKTAVVVSNKESVDLSDGSLYYLLAEVPTATADDDFHFVGIMLKSQHDINNLIADVSENHSWAKQFVNLRNSGVR